MRKAAIAVISIQFAVIIYLLYKDDPPRTPGDNPLPGKATREVATHRPVDLTKTMAVATTPGRKEAVSRNGVKADDKAHTGPNKLAMENNAPPRQAPSEQEDVYIANENFSQILASSLSSGVWGEREYMAMMKYLPYRFTEQTDQYLAELQQAINSGAVAVMAPGPPPPPRYQPHVSHPKE